ncbi:phospholipase A2 inhibitor and Ly6/PLAUR domain-containing protein-like [Leptodactylus fuscus]|uniref:phospholipase A2 inhibitor and Ly6/PLAUR domain-containing protein-like n=1 Tax=Leptodactylus fuscus TaxID=238119 RepID=UPI003F4E462C
MKYFLIFFVIAMGEITVDGAMKCHQCKAVGKVDCTGECVECPHEDDFCYQGIEYNILDGHWIPTVSRGCHNLTLLCNGPIYVSTTRFQLISNFQCCSSDDCNSEKMTLPPLNLTKNGLSCKSCFVEGSYECDKYEPLPCVGDQEDCFQFHGVGGRPGQGFKKYAFAGCTKKGACETGFRSLLRTEAGYPSELTFPCKNRMENTNLC